MIKEDSIKIEQPEKSRMCDLGYHVVRGHYRVCQSGTKTWGDIHLRKNRGEKVMYLEENLLFLYWNNKKKFKEINAVKGFSPLAIESSFRTNARPRTSSAVGLMQLLKGARSSLLGTKNTKNNEVKNHHISVSEDQLEDPVVNIAVGTRWFAHKFYLMRNHKDRSLKKTLKFYHSNDDAGEKYAEKILKLYDQSK